MEQEIKRRWKNMKQNKESVIILSQLYDCPIAYIREVLDLPEPIAKTKKDKVLQLAESGMNTHEISKKLNIEIKTCRTYISKYGAKNYLHKPKLKQKEILTKQQKIKKMWNEGTGIKTIAKEMEMEEKGVIKVVMNA